MDLLKVGTRGSELALYQSNLVAEKLRSRVPGLRTELVEIKTRGDLRQERPRLGGDDKKDWVAELEQALLQGEIDIAVHSAKDVPGNIEANTTLKSVLRRAPAQDVLIISPELRSAGIKNLEDLPEAARIGTSSLRRSAQLRRKRKDLEILSLRGNVPTRVGKLEAGGYDAIVLAQAGLERLGLFKEDYCVLPLDDFIPAVNQGIVCVQFLESREALRSCVSQISEEDTTLCWSVERAFIQTIQADCGSSVGVIAQVQNSEIKVVARALSMDGQRAVGDSMIVDKEMGAEVGEKLGEKLLEANIQELL